MTWVIGSPTPFGYAVGLSDVQVSWGKNGPRRDCLRKIYQVAPFIAAGFSGSVQLGFQLLQDLTQFLSPMPEPGTSWIPRWVALKWWRRARRIFEGAQKAQQELGVSVMLMGVRPTDNSGCITGGHPDVIVLSARNLFEPEYVSLGDVRSIGSGNNVELYMQVLRGWQSDSPVYMKAEIGAPGGMGRARMLSIARMLRQNPTPGISQFVHYVRVCRDSVQIEPLNLLEITSDGTRIDYKMPDVATGWRQFEESAKYQGLTAAEAIA